ncbi:MAG: SDR family oxidoreductase [Porticoccaceae bacterium]
MKVLFIGCGDIAQRTAKGLSKKYDCFGLRRNPEKLPTEITPITADASNAQQLFSVASGGFDIWVATLTPAEFTRQAYQQSYLAVAQAMAQTVNALHQAPKLIIWVSSTSVYGDNKGDWVDETTKPNPVTFSGEILLQAEQIIQNLPCSSTVVRFSGIYGPGRTRLLSQVRAGKGRPKLPEHWTNRIHADDCAGVLAHLIGRSESGNLIEPIYLASDCQPVTQHDVRQWLAKQLSVDLVEETVAIGPVRRCSNRLLMESGFSFNYPSFREGYTALIEDQ